MTQRSTPPQATPQVNSERTSALPPLRPRERAQPSLWALLKPQRAAMSSGLKSFVTTWRLPVFGSLALLCVIGCYFAGDFLFAQLERTELLAPLLMRKTMGFIFDFFTWMLLFSTTISAFSTHYLAQDLPRLIHAPISATRLFYVRSVEAWAQTSWMLLMFALPTLAGAGVRLGAPISFHLTLFVCVCLISVACAMGACALTLIIARLFPAKRIQDVMVLLLVLAFVYFYTKLQASQPGRFFREDGFKDLVEMVKGLREVGQEAGLSGWAVSAIFGTLPAQEGGLLRLPEPTFGISAAHLSLLSLAGTTAGLTALAGLIAKWVYLPGYWLAQEGLGQPPKEGGGRRAKPTFLGDPQRAIKKRESLIFWRTPAQWTQLLLVGSLVMVYVFNFKYFKTLHSTGFFTSVSLFFSHVGFSCMALITLAARFLYPSVSAEGKALWVVQSAPISARELLWAKVRWGFTPMWLLSQALTLTGAWLTDMPLPWLIAGAWSSTLLSLVIVCLGVGLGAAQPKFHLANPMMVASSLGGVSFMLLSLLFMALFSALAYPVVRTLNEGLAGAWPMGSGWSASALALLGVHLLSVGVAWGALKVGERGLERVLLGSE